MKIQRARIVAGLVTMLVVFGARSAGADEGDLDPRFGVDGVTSFAFGDDDELFRGIAIQNDGKIVVVGKAKIFSTDEITIARYDAAGNLDPTFSIDGVDRQNPGLGDDEAWNVAIQADGKIVVAGCSVVDVSQRIALLRYNHDGTLDTTFDTDGIAFGAADTCAQGVAIQADGKIVVAGYSGSRDALMVARFTATGLADTTFSGDGIDIQDLGLGVEEAFDVGIQSDGRVVVAGCSLTDTTQNMILLRYTTSGALDPSFDSDGILLDIGAFGDDCLHGLAIQPDGRIVVAGTGNNRSSTLVARYTTAGARDMSFSGDGIDLQNIGLGDDVLWDLALQADGKIVVAGSTLIDVVDEHLIMRYETDGTLDTTFGSPDGWTTLRVGSIESGGRGVAIQTDEQIVVTGFETDGSGTLGTTVQVHGPGFIFADGFESGDTSSW